MGSISTLDEYQQVSAGLSDCRRLLGQVDPIELQRHGRALTALDNELLASGQSTGTTTPDARVTLCQLLKNVKKFEVVSRSIRARVWAPVQPN